MGISGVVEITQNGLFGGGLHSLPVMGLLPTRVGLLVATRAAFAADVTCGGVASIRSSLSKSAEQTSNQ